MGASSTKRKTPSSNSAATQGEECNFTDLSSEQSLELELEPDAIHDELDFGTNNNNPVRPPLSGTNGNALPEPAAAVVTPMANHVGSPEVFSSARMYEVIGKGITEQLNARTKEVNGLKKLARLQNKTIMSLYTSVDEHAGACDDRKQEKIGSCLGVGLGLVTEAGALTYLHYVVIGAVALASAPAFTIFAGVVLVGIAFIACGFWWDWRTFEKKKANDRPVGLTKAQKTLLEKHKKQQSQATLC